MCLPISAADAAILIPDGASIMFGGFMGVGDHAVSGERDYRIEVRRGQSENGIIGFGAPPPQGMEDPNLTDAGGGFISALPGAVSFDSATSFALIRGGHLAMTVLGGLQVDANGRLANWMVPGKLVPGMGGAMDLVAGAKRVIVAMQHAARGEPKIVEELTLPLTSVRRVSLVVTDMAVIRPTVEGLELLERAPGVSVEEIVAATGAKLLILGDIPEMPVVIPETETA